MSWHIHHTNTMQEPQVILLIDTRVKQSEASRSFSLRFCFHGRLSLSRNTRDQTVTAAPLQLRGVRGQSVCSGCRLRGVRVKTPGEARLFISTEPSVGGRRGVLPAHSAVVWATNCTGRKNITQPPRHCVRRKGNHGNRAERLRNRRWLEEGRVRYNPGWV